MRPQSTASRFYKLQYTTDGSTFQDLTGPLEFVNNFGAYSTSNSVSLAGLPQSATFGIRIVSIFQPGTAAYSATGAYAPAGFLELDLESFGRANTWTGGSGNLQDAAHWSNGAPVSAGLSSNLVFGSVASANVTVTNTAPFTALTLSFAPNTTTSYDITGQSLTLGNTSSANGLLGMTTLTNGSSLNQTISAPVVVGRRQTWDVGSTTGGALTFNSTVALLDDLTITGANNTTFNGELFASTAGTTITKMGTGIMTINASATTSGNGGVAVNVNQGTLRVTNPAGGSATGDAPVMVAAGANLVGAQGVGAGTRGFINGPVTIFGAVQPGTTATSTSAGQINFNGPSQTVMFNAGSKYTWDLAALTDATNQAGIGYDQIGTQNGPGLNLTGGVVELAFNGTTTPMMNSFWQSPHQWTILQVSGTPNTSQFGGISNANLFSSVGTFSLSLVGATGNVTLNFTPVITPEPTFILSVGMAGLGLLWRLRRRSQSVE